MCSGECGYRVHDGNDRLQFAQLPSRRLAIICRPAFRASSPKTSQADLLGRLFFCGLHSFTTGGFALGSPMIIERSTVYPQVLRPLSTKLSTPYPGLDN
jgi:hypothetical protein